MCLAVKEVRPENDYMLLLTFDKAIKGSLI
jgi:hypothetical protein